MRFIKFTHDCNVNDENGESVFSAKAGDYRELEPASAERWINRGFAVESEKPVLKKKAAKKADKE